MAVSVAALAWVGNVVSTWWSGRLQRALEQEKAVQQLDLEKTKAESERILEMIKTGDPEKARMNLRFLLGAGLITSQEQMAKLNAYLEKTPPGSGPALPPSGALFSIGSSDLTKAQQDALQERLDGFTAYLDKVGFSVVARRVSVQGVDFSGRPSAEYYGRASVILIDRRVIDDPFPTYKEYMHHLLGADKAEFLSESSFGTIESGVGDYFSGSFAGNPVLGTPQSAQAFGYELNHPYIRRLDNNLTFRPYKAGDYPHEYGEMWGGAFWDMRSALGAELADRIIALAWQSMPWPIPDDAAVSRFVRQLLAATQQRAETRVADVKRILGQRKIPLPH